MYRRVLVKTTTPKKTNPIVNINIVPEENETHEIVKLPATAEDAAASLETHKQETDATESIVEKVSQVGVSEASSWQTECQDLHERLAVLLDRGLWSDCEVLVGSSAQSFQAHRVILASASPVLANMLYDAPTCTEPDRPLALPKIDPETFKLLLKYFYTDKVTIDCSEIACSLYEASHYLMITQLQVKCKQYLSSAVTPDKFIFVYEFAEKFNVNELKERYLEMIIDKAHVVLDSDCIANARIETLEKIFALPNLNINSELELFKAAERWVHARIYTDAKNGKMCKNNKKLDTDSKNYSEKMDPKSLIRRVLKHIRFLAMKPEEFEKHDMSFLLSEAELLALLLNLNSRETYMSMPSGFSTSREMRRQQPIVFYIDSGLSTSSETKLQQIRKIDVCVDELDNIFEINFDFELFPLVNEASWEFKISRIKQDDFNYCKDSEGFPFYLYNCEINLICYWTSDGNAKHTFDALVELCILRQKGVSQFYWKDKHHFTIVNDRDNVDNIFTIKDLINWADMLDPENRYVKNERLTIEVKITSETPVVVKELANISQA